VAELTRITVYPFKSLDGRCPGTSRIVENGALAGDREFAAFDADGEYVNGKRERAIHRVAAEWERGTGRDQENRTDRNDEPVVTLGVPNAEPTTVGLGSGSGRRTAASYLGGFLGYEVEVRRDAAGGFPDDRALSGPTVISTATIREVASWFDGIDESRMRRRLRANLEIGGVPAFWEDRLFAGPGEGVAFEVGDLRLVGVNPCQRCVVPARDPDTGEEYPGFREQFVERRRETKPPWTDGARFDHEFRLMLNTVVPPEEVGTRVAVGDEVRIDGTVPVEG
jgi:uncharacterized protein YcbX